METKTEGFTIDITQYLTKIGGYYQGDNPKHEFRSKEELRNLLMVDDDMGTVDIKPTGVFAEYQNKLKSILKDVDMEANQSTPTAP